MYYNFKNALTDVRSVIHLIGMEGPNLIGLELGVDRAESHCTILQNCPNVKKLYGIDAYEPYTDFMNPKGEGPLNSVGPAEIEVIEWTAHHNIRWSGEEHRSEIWKGRTEDLHKRTDNETFDFIFMDAWLSYEQVCRELNDWYPKLKKGGLFIGHDYDCERVSLAVAQFREAYSIDNHMSVYDSMFVWRK